ncbi:MAG: glycosyltransferase family 4 protein [Acidimicrobiales bacterium]
MATTTEITGLGLESDTGAILAAIRVLVVTRLYPPHGVGGYELTCLDTVERWRAKGHDVTVLTSDARVPGARDAGSEPHVRRQLTLLGLAPNGVRVPTAWQMRLAVVGDHISVARLLRRRPDVISVWNPAGLSLGLLGRLEASGRPLVYVISDHWPEYAPSVDPTRHWPLTPWRGPGAQSTAVFCSKSLRARLVRYGFEGHDSRVVWPGVDRGDFPPVITTDQRPWRWRLLFVGRLAAEKGVATAVRALAHLPKPSILDIVGHGAPDFVDHLRALATEVGARDRVRFSVADRAELSARYAAADAVVFPSEWEEPFGLVPLEAMACATPVVATATGGSGEYLRDGGNCVVFRAGDEADLANAVQRLAGDPGLRRRLVVAASATAARFTADRMAAELEAVHLEACHRNVAGSTTGTPA